tara:strand:+ start:178 stop:399 length:222 start_codon:yes stop_codon:yes gene_type:complete
VGKAASQTQKSKKEATGAIYASAVFAIAKVAGTNSAQLKQRKNSTTMGRVGILQRQEHAAKQPGVLFLLRATL